VIRIEDRVERAKFAVEPKIDGLSVVLHYRDGLFVQGARRGDGEIGDDITANLPIPVDPKGPKPPAYLVVRGEAFMPIKEFHDLR
jgi:DNA ligase (NAD+)